jgi:hypothetical protein
MTDGLLTAHPVYPANTAVLRRATPPVSSEYTDGDDVAAPPEVDDTSRVDMCVRN